LSFLPHLRRPPVPCVGHGAADRPIKAGSFDDRSWLRPVGHIWTASAQPWFAAPQGMVNDPGDPASMAPYMDRWREMTEGWFAT
jgi:hypothetical protein